MLLKDAIKRAAKFIDKTKDGPMVGKSLRLIPKHGEMPNRLYATNGLVGILVDVVQDLPNLVLPADALVKSVRDTRVISKIEDRGMNRAEVTTVGKAASDEAVYSLQGLPPSEFPGFPAMPETFHTVTYWEHVSKVIHAASKDADKPELCNVHFRPTVVEATDKVRIARTEISGPWAGLVPAEVFKDWPKKYEGEVSCAFTEYHSFWKVGDEIRFGFIQKDDKYPDLAHLIPEEHEGPWVNLNVKSLIETVKKAADLSPMNAAVLDFGLMGVTIRAWSKEELAFVAELKGSNHLPGGKGFEGCQLLVSGKALVEALKVIETPKVRLCYQSSQHPLRLESSTHVECLWPMLSENPGE
jgi:DNA polymerase III sliding clamp (beta) subunit (PCNA family)